MPRLDRENELMGNLSLNKELDFILTVNDWIAEYGGRFAQEYKHVTGRTIKMTRQTAAELRYSSKFDRSLGFMDRLRREGQAVAQDWLNRWPWRVALISKTPAIGRDDGFIDAARLHLLCEFWGADRRTWIRLTGDARPAGRARRCWRAPGVR
jgi:hypothetical protein